MKNSVKFIIVIFLLTLTIFNFTSITGKTEKSSMLELKNIHLLSANAEGELGHACYGGCQYATYSDVCFLCSPCTFIMGSMSIGYWSTCI